MSDIVKGLGAIRIAVKAQDVGAPYGSWWMAIARDEGQTDDEVAGNGQIVDERTARELAYIVGGSNMDEFRRAVFGAVPEVRYHQ